MSVSCHLAVDLGAESGRIMSARIEAGRIALSEVHRFDNRPIEHKGVLRWNFERMMDEIKIGLARAVRQEKRIASLGVDTWGVDYGLLDRNGRLLEPPVHYRDGRTRNILDVAYRIMPPREVYNATGIQLMPINTLFQLLACRMQTPETLARADKLLFMPDLIVYFLTGTMQAEATIASTSQMMDMRTRAWSDPVLEAFGIPRRLLPDIVAPGGIVGKIKPDLAAALGCEPFDVVRVGGHDTASAVAGVPAREDTRWAFLSSGTWSLIGQELPEPIIDDASYGAQLANEGGLNRTVRLLKNIAGLWLVQQCRQSWADQGESYSYAQLTDMAASAVAPAMIDVDHPSFAEPGAMPEKIARQLLAQGVPDIKDKGQIVRAVLESLARRYAETLSRIETVSGRPADVLHIVGGGSQNTLLNRLTADATGKIVLAGPVEATVLGNVLAQALALGYLDSIASGRALVAESFALES